MKWMCGVVLIATAACSPTEVCHLGIWLEASPADTTLRLGDAFDPEVRMAGCPDTRRVDAVLSTEDAGVVEITDGSITAVGLGEAEVTAAAQGLTAVMAIEVVD